MSPSQAKVLAPLGIFCIGFASKKLLDSAFDFVAYPAALIALGVVWGGALMTVLSVVVNILLIRTYDTLRCDFLLLEALKSLQCAKGSSRLQQLVAWVLRRGDVPAFFVLSWIEDAVVVTLYLRKGSHLYNGLSRRDWTIFVASTVTANLFWIVSVSSIIEIVRLVLRII